MPAETALEYETLKTTFLTSGLHPRSAATRTVLWTTFLHTLCSNNPKKSCGYMLMKANVLRVSN